MSYLNVVLLMTLVAATVIHQGDSQLARVPLDEDIRHPGKCVYENEPHDVGSQWSAKSGCGRADCAKRDDGKYLVTIAGCGKLHVGDGCTLVSDNTLPYPDCCPKPKCN